MVDAYKALGGEADKSGHISAKKLRDTIKNEFELTIDIDVITLVFVIFVEADYGDRYR